MLPRCTTAARSSLNAPFRSIRRVHRRGPDPPSPELTALIARFVEQGDSPLTLSSLLSFANPLTEQSVLASAQYVQSEIPKRLATRVQSLELLPFIVGTNPYIEHIRDAHRRSFEVLARHPPIQSLDDNVQYTSVLQDLVERHAQDIPLMAKG
jgi:26S proteasome regulatory subunit T1